MKPTLDWTNPNDDPFSIETNPTPMPSSMTKLIPLPIQLLLIAIALLGFANVSLGEDLVLHFVSGDVANVEVTTPTLDWKTIEKDGTTRPSAIPWQNISKLTLTNSPAAKQAERVTNALLNLSHPDYQIRQQAEVDLIEIGNGFRDIIKTYQSSDSLEVRIRAKRILDRLSDSDKKIRIEYDALTTKNGTLLQGDAGNFEIKCRYRGRDLSILRSQLVSIIKPLERESIPTGDASSRPVEFQAFYEPGSKFYSNEQTTVDFSATATGNELNSTNSVQDAYIPIGLKLSTEEKDGTVVISSYEFNAFGKLPSEQSIAVYTKIKRFRGTINIEFCMPNQPSVPAGVKEFGMFIARIENSRDFIMECYGENSELVSAIDCYKDGGCGFIGFQSSVPITRIRVLSNPHLFRIDRTVDDDYGLDHFCFSTPIATRLNLPNEPAVRLKNGDTLRCSSLEYDADQVKVQTEVFGMLEFPVGDVAEVNFSESSSTNETSAWVAMLDDASQIVVTPGQSFSSATLGQSIEADQLRALYNQKALFRYPFSGDMTLASKLLVFPTCRIATPSLTFSEIGFSWDADSKKILQPVDEKDPLNVDGEDPTPQVNQVVYGKSTVEDLPTIWLGTPVAPASWCGVVKTEQGEVFVFGENANFKLDSINRNTVSLNGFGKKIEIPIAEITSIHWPTN